jgi:hypothetical protein
MSWKAEVLVGGDTKWYDNGLRFVGKLEAMAYGNDLADRWTSVREVRVAESEDQVTHNWAAGRALRIEEQP